MNAVLKTLSYALMMLVGGVFVVATASAACTTAAFPYSRKQGLRELKVLLEKLDRPSIEAYYFHELTAKSADSPDAVSKALGRFLAQTERDRDMRTYYRMLSYIAGWTDPQPDEKPHALPLNEICAMKELVMAKKGGEAAHE
jgi:hypothetical protein